MMSVYCSCGNIVSLDYRKMSLKLLLGKDLQCTKCRNLRISDEIEKLDNIFNGSTDEEC